MRKKKRVVYEGNEKRAKMKDNDQCLKCSKHKTKCSGYKFSVKVLSFYCPKFEKKK